MDYLSPNSAYLTYNIREHSLCEDKGAIICPYTSLGRETECCQDLLTPFSLITATMTTLRFPRS